MPSPTRPRFGNGAILAVPCMPDGRAAPWVLTAAELVEFLRLENRFPGETVKRYRRGGGLPAVQVGAHVRYLLPDVLRWLDQRQELDPR